MKNLIRLMFRWQARRIIRRYKPLVVGVAGSVGKTGTKDAIAGALGDAKRRVRKTEGSFNAEIGVPVTIIAGGKARDSWTGWLGVLSLGLRALVKRQIYPDALVLEMGSDKPGDLQTLLKIVTPSIGVLTSTAPEHLEFFGDEASVIAEESLIVRTLPPTATAVINIDDQRNEALLPQLVAKKITYGWNERADIRAESITMVNDERQLPTGMVLKIAVQGNVIPIALPGVLGQHQALPVLAAVAVGVAAGDSVAQMLPRLSAYRPPAGRMRLFPGREGSMIIDDSYNASPEAVSAAVETLINLHVPGKKYAILGQMSELGAAANDWHDSIGRLFGPKSVNRLITVGPLAARYADAAVSVGFPATHVAKVNDAEAAAAELMPDLGPGDIVLIKGSRYASRLEKAVKILLANPDRDSKELIGG